MQTRGPEKARNTIPTHRGWESSATMRSRTSPSRTNPVEATVGAVPRREGRELPGLPDATMPGAAELSV
jgi:hypothetical protein